MTDTPRTPADQPRPQTTVVIPVWDEYVSERLEQALERLRAQQTPPPPIVVVDNASAVALPTLPGAWVLRSPTRLTLGAARNLGLMRVETPYVVFWDADDLMLEGTLQFLEAAISSDPTVALGLEQLRTADSPWARTRIIARKVFPPPGFIRQWWPPAARNWRMLILGYLYRPVWLLRRAPQGFKAWREARRQVHGHSSN